ncbi:hypothetical protein Bca101_088875 [Brassica carinata]
MGKVLKYCSGGSSIRSRQGLERGSEVPQRRHEVAPAGSDVIRATRLSRSHIRCPELESRSGSDVSQRPREVARVFCRWERRDQSDSAKSLAFTATQSDPSERPLQVAPESVQVSPSSILSGLIQFNQP